MSARSRPDVSEFSIVVGILPLPAAQMREYIFPLPKTPEARDGAFYGKVWPGHAGYDETRSWWQLPEKDIPSTGPVLRAFLVDGVAPMLVRSLNRDILLRWDGDSTLLAATCGRTSSSFGRGVELHGMRKTDAIYILRLLDDEYTAALVKDLVSAYLSEAFRFRVRETLDRLPRRDLAHLVPAAAWQLLEELEGDDYQYEWIAELFNELGLQDALSELAERALTSSDPAVRTAHPTGKRI